MSLTLSQMASRVLRDAQIPEDSSTASVQALADAKQYINERARKIHAESVLPEYNILGSYSVPASTKFVALSSISVLTGFSTAANGYGAAFDIIIAAREGSNPLMPEDPSALNALNASLWESTTSPVSFMPRGKSGIYLLGEYSSATDLSFYGKGTFQDLTDAEYWIVDADNALIAGATSDIQRFHNRDMNAASASEQVFISECLKLNSRIKVQQANIQRFVPINPWTAGDFGSFTQSYSPTGA